MREIRQLVWNEWNIQHIWERHHRTRAEVEEACGANPQDIYFEDARDGRVRVTAPRPNGQLLVVVLGSEGEGRYYGCYGPATEAAGNTGIRSLEGRENTMSEHLKYPTQGHGAIPSFKCLEEEAAWWDETDTGAPEIEAELRPITARFTVGKPLSEGFKVRFDAETVQKLRERAQAKGVGPTTLIRMLVLEQLRRDDERDAS